MSLSPLDAGGEAPSDISSEPAPTILTSLSLSMGTRRTPLSAGLAAPARRDGRFCGVLSGCGGTALPSFDGAGFGPSLEVPSFEPTVDELGGWAGGLGCGL